MRDRDKAEALRLRNQARRKREQAQEDARKKAEVREVQIKNALARTLVPAVVVPMDSWGQRINKLAPRAYQDPAFRAAVDRLKVFPPVRPLEDWSPKGKSVTTVFRSLCEHVLAKFPMPGHFWEVFFATDARVRDIFMPIVAAAARGESLFKLCQIYGLPLTRAMCHDFLNSRGEESLLAALRWVQIRALGGDRRLHQTCMHTHIASTLHSKEDEVFWLTVIQWLIQNPMLDRDKIAPLVDYIRFRRQRDATFSMKGRGALALLRAMEEWHGDLAHAKLAKNKVFVPSGISGAEYSVPFRLASGAQITETWRVFEILSARELLDEGKAMSHCVYSYSQSIERGTVSIWSVTKEDNTGNWRMLTVEVINQTRSVVQARGRFNYKADLRSFQILNRWAGANNLTLSSYL